MTQAFTVQHKATTLSVNVDGYRVTVSVESITGDTVTQEEAAIALTKAISEFPQRVRY